MSLCNITFIKIKKWVIIKIYLWQKLYPKKTGKILLSVEISFDFRRKNDFPKIARRPLNSHDFRGDVTKKRGIVFHKEQRRTKGENELLYLRAGNDVDIIERFVPNIQVRAFAKASSECRFLFLARAHGRQIGGEILFSETQFIQNGLKQAFLYSILTGVFAERTRKGIRILRDIRNF